MYELTERTEAHMTLLAHAACAKAFVKTMHGFPVWRFYIRRANQFALPYGSHEVSLEDLSESVGVVECIGRLFDQDSGIENYAFRVSGMGLDFYFVPDTGDILRKVSGK